MISEELSVDTSASHVVDLTPQLAQFCNGKGDGLAQAFLPHATAALALIELGSGSEEDLLELIGELLPPERQYRHQHGHRGHGRDHLVPALLGSSVTIPVLGGRPLLGTWQSLALVDTNRDNTRRRVRLSFLAG